MRSKNDYEPRYWSISAEALLDEYCGKKGLFMANVITFPQQRSAYNDLSNRVGKIMMDDDGIDKVFDSPESYMQFQKWKFALKKCGTCLPTSVSNTRLSQRAIWQLELKSRIVSDLSTVDAVVLSGEKFLSFYYDTGYLFSLNELIEQHYEQEWECQKKRVLLSANLVKFGERSSSYSRLLEQTGEKPILPVVVLKENEWNDPEKVARLNRLSDWTIVPPTKDQPDFYGGNYMGELLSAIRKFNRGSEPSPMATL